MPTLFYILLVPAFYLLLSVSIYTIILMRRHGRRLNIGRVCLLVAHPDDEAMFFGPTLRALSHMGVKIHVLCMTKGDFYGRGDTRVKEMRASCDFLIGVGLENVHVVDEPEKLPDSPVVNWDRKLALDIVATYIRENSIQTLITFDRYESPHLWVWGYGFNAQHFCPRRHGVSSHPNHCELFTVCEELLKDEPGLNVLYLETVNRMRKYSFFFDLLPTLMFNCDHSNLVFVNSPRDFGEVFGAMMQHSSQLVWFRWIYLFTSRYMLMNNFKRL